MGPATLQNPQSPCMPMQLDQAGVRPSVLMLSVVFRKRGASPFKVCPILPAAARYISLNLGAARYISLHFGGSRCISPRLETSFARPKHPVKPCRTLLHLTWGGPYAGASSFAPAPGSGLRQCDTSRYISLHLATSRYISVNLGEIRYASTKNHPDAAPQPKPPAHYPASTRTPYNAATASITWRISSSVL
jgi:hypothetical protein